MGVLLVYFGISDNQYDHLLYINESRKKQINLDILNNNRIVKICMESYLKRGTWCGPQQCKIHSISHQTLRTPPQLLNSPQLCKIFSPQHRIRWLKGHPPRSIPEYGNKTPNLHIWIRRSVVSVSSSYEFLFIRIHGYISSAWPAFPV